MNQEVQKNGKIIPFNAEDFKQIDYAMEDPDNWLFEDELEKEEEDLKDKGCGKVKMMDMDPNKF